MLEPKAANKESRLPGTLFIAMALFAAVTAFLSLDPGWRPSGGVFAFLAHLGPLVRAGGFLAFAALLGTIGIGMLRWSPRCS